MSGGLSIPVVESLTAELEQRRTKALQAVIAKRGIYERKNPILSDLGDCDRQIAYGVTNPEAKPQITPELQARFDIGNLMEREMTKDLLDLEFDFQGSQKAIKVLGNGGTLLATGKIDGFIKWEGELIPVEFKSMHPNIYAQIKTLEDFQKKPWLRKYLRQLMMYMFGEGKEYGLFGITNCLGAKKWFTLYLDLGECELLLQRLENIQLHLAAFELPDRIEYRDDICGRCDFAGICLPDIMRNEAQILTDEVLLTDLQRRESLKEAAKDYKRLDESVKERLAGIPKGVAGNFMIVGKTLTRRAYEKGPEIDPTHHWKTDIKFLGQGGKL